MFIKKALTIAALSAVASVSYAGSAHAIGFTYSAGAYRDAQTNQGAFSENVNNSGYTTYDFDNGKVPGNDQIKYTFSSGDYSTTANSTTGIYSDVWAPSGVKGEENNSNYLAVFSNSSVSIQATGGKTFNYFGFDAGALSSGNTIQFFNGDKKLLELDYDAMTKDAPVAASQHGGQKNGFFEFFSQSNNDNFDKIVLSQVGGGGFESDNHTFRIDTGAHTTSVPEPGVVLGLVGVGGMFLRKRKIHKTA